MVSIGALIVDFDGTVCLHDVGVDLLERFGADGTRSGALVEVDRAFEAGAIGLRDVLLAGEPSPWWRVPA
jgi:2-hydroxy-3-keto-5-methylthiopentenyl-1-phosphate phosphatase